MKGLRHCWVSISTMPQAFNYGNRLIEHCLRKVLKLDTDEYQVNAYLTLSEREIEEVNSCDFVVWPGCTLIQRHEHPVMEQMQFARPPTFCFGGAFFTRLPYPHPQYCRRVERPVGARDSFTHRRLQLYGIPSKFIGCPTLFSGEATTWKAMVDGPVVFCFGRDNLKQQLQVFDTIRREVPVRVVIQEEKQRRCCPDGVDIVDYDDVERVIEAYATASVVVTGRLHAAIPAIVSGTPVVFSQLVHDSRITLLKDIGLKVRNPYSSDIVPLVRRLRSGEESLPTDVFGKISALKQVYLEFVDDFRERVSLLQENAT